MTTKLSQHFTLEELTVSQTAARRGINNVPKGAALKVLESTACRMEVVRALLGNRPIIVTSGYRGPELNAAIGGSKTSAHMTGHAVDFICPGFGTPYDIALHLAKALTGYDQIIQEFGNWVHIGFGPGQRKQLLTARSVGGRTQYVQGIHR